MALDADDQLEKLDEMDNKILSDNWHNVLKQVQTIIQNTDYDDTKDGNENFREKISFSFLNQEKIINLYDLLQETILDKIKDYKKKENEGKSVRVLGIIRRHIKDLNLIFGFVHILYTLKPNDYSSIQIKNMFQYVYDNIFDPKNKDTVEIINFVKDILYNIKPELKCTIRERAKNDEGKNSSSKGVLKLRQNRCIGKALLKLNTETERDQSLKEIIDINKVYIKEIFIDACMLALNRMIAPHNLDKKEDSWQNVIYTILETEENGLCKQLGATIFGNVKLEFGIDLDTFKFVIFRWGRWREFDPINYVIKVDLTGDKTKDKELRKNPFSDGARRVYQGTPYYYHTVLRMLENNCRNGMANPEKVFYYSIIHRTFFRESNYEPIKIYTNVDNERAGCISLKELMDRDNLREKFDHNSNVKVLVLKEILKTGDASCQNRDEFLFPFVQEFYGAMDEITNAGKINIVEKMIFDDDNEERMKTIENYKEDPGEDEREEQREVLERLRDTVERRAAADKREAAVRR